MLTTREVRNTGGRYVTDGKRLFRILEADERTEPPGIIELEDCRSYELVLVAIRELPRMSLRPVASGR